MINQIRSKFAAGAVLMLGAAMLAGAPSQAPAHGAQDGTLAVKAIAEVETKVSAHGRETTQLVPADRVVPGDEVIYSLEIRNTGAAPVPEPSVRFAIPHPMRYLAGSAAGPGARVSFSIDGGRTFGSPESLQVAGKDGRMRPATAADYTHIRWQLKQPLNANSVAYARFRAVVK
jgi:hypothetical protein